MKKLTAIIASAAVALSAIMLFAANVFASAPCSGIYCEPEVPEMLRR